MSKLMTLFEIAPVNRQVLDSALAGDFADFEDAVLHEAACLAGAHAIVTRNGKDFTHSRIPVYAPADIVKVISEEFQVKNQTI